MPSQGPNNPRTVVNDASIGVVAWADPSNAKASDDAKATAALDPGFGDNPSNYLKATDFGFAIPGGASIDGIVVEVERNASAAPGIVSDNAVRIVKGGTIGSTDKGTGTGWSEGADEIVSYGSSTDLWGETWTPTDINASNFGMAISATASANPQTARIDHVKITVYFTGGDSFHAVQIPSVAFSRRYVSIGY